VLDSAVNHMLHLVLVKFIGKAALKWLFEAHLDCIQTSGRASDNVS
jgi:hypothetical protein